MIVLDETTKRYVVYGLCGVAVAFLVVGIFIPSAREYLISVSKLLMSTAGMSTQ